MAAVPGAPLTLSSNYAPKHRFAEAAEEAFETCLRALREPRQSWQFVQDKDGVHVSKKEIPGAPVPVCRGDAELNFPAVGLARIVNSEIEKTQLELDKQQNKVVILEELDAQTTVVLTEFNGIFPVANRWFCVCSSVIRVPEGLAIINFSVDYPTAAAKVSRGAVQGHVYYAGWLLTPTSSQKTQVTYVAYTNLNGNIPKFVVNMVVNDNPMIVRNLGRVAARCEFTEEDQLTASHGEPAPEPPVLESAPTSALSYMSVPSTMPLHKSPPSLSRASTWKDWSGRSHGRNGYQLGDLKRGWKRKQLLKALHKQITEHELGASVGPVSLGSQLVTGQRDLETELIIDASAALAKAKNLDIADKLQAYALHQQAVEGPLVKARPQSGLVLECFKHDAWASLGQMDSATARKAYFSLADKVAPGWKTSSSARADGPPRFPAILSLPVRNNHVGGRSPLPAILAALGGVLLLRFLVRLRARARALPAP